MHGQFGRGGRSCPHRLDQRIAAAQLGQRGHALLALDEVLFELFGLRLGQQPQQHSAFRFFTLGARGRNGHKALRIKGGGQRIGYIVGTGSGSRPKANYAEKRKPNTCRSIFFVAWASPTGQQPHYPEP